MLFKVNSTNEKFVGKQGKTYVARKGENVEFGDFVIKLLGQLLPKKIQDQKGKEGYWVASCGVMTFGQLESRSVSMYNFLTVILP